MTRKSCAGHHRHSPAGLFHQDLEKLLDVFNITLARQQAHMEVKTTEIFLSSVSQLVGRNSKEGHRAVLIGLQLCGQFAEGFKVYVFIKKEKENL